MKKKIYFIILISLVISLALVSASITSDLRKEINSCKKTCVLDKKEVLNNVNSNYKICLDSCNSDTNLTRSDKRICSKSCKSERKDLIKDAKLEARECTNNCKYRVQNLNVSCSFNNQTYQAEDKFVDSCQTCECNYQGNIVCKPQRNCGFSNFTFTEESCTSSNGLFQRLCNGPYFGQKCSVKNFCQCSGDNEYSCPLNSVCVKNFTVPDIPMIIPKWTDTNGNLLGDIGICAHQE